MSKEEWQHRYNTSEKGKARMAKFRRTEKGKASSMKQKEQRIARGVCKSCGRPILEGTKLHCIICIDGGTLRRKLSDALREID